MSEGDGQWVWPMLTAGVAGGIVVGFGGRMLSLHSKFVGTDQPSAGKRPTLGMGLLGGAILLALFDPTAVMTVGMAFITALALTFFIWSFGQRRDVQEQ